MTKTSSVTPNVSQHKTENPDPVTAPAKPLWRRLLPLIILICGLVGAWASGVLDLLSFDTLRDNRELLQDLVSSKPTLSILGFMGIYVIAVALSLPLGSILTISGGFLFGAVLGTTYVVSAATLGAVIVYLAARYAFYDVMHNKAGSAIRKMEHGFAENAFSYLMVLRLIPIFPFWLVNLVPALLGVPLRSFILGTLLGIIPGTFVYASIGDGLGALFDQGKTPDLGVIFEPRILTPIIGLAVLALMPVACKKLRKSKSGDANHE
ncbi:MULTISPECIES: TVP38/TMEM64 family protein [Thalassospira]|uniref:Membrane protein n=2 Tax=Thalassospira TaxID=168934 RepID=A0A367WFC3_9PROT|nr:MULTISPECIES: TVP38/TMEM64 family protein [Thalassospira]MDG4718989.1 TVP38/TMEM64 family protein [Thalassospira sp. FZY0004]RCK39949.1 membrane protein [Thalassospira profundimaris]